MQARNRLCSDHRRGAGPVLHLGRNHLLSLDLICEDTRQDTAAAAGSERNNYFDSLRGLRRSAMASQRRNQSGGDSQRG